MDVLKDFVMEQPLSLVWTEVVKKAAEKMYGTPQNAAERTSKQGPNRNTKKWSADNGALSVKLNHDRRVTFAAARDDATVLVAHVFNSIHSLKQYDDYSCVIGARKDIDPPEYKIHKIRVHGKTQDDVADQDDDDSESFTCVCNVCGASFGSANSNAFKQHLASKKCHLRHFGQAGAAPQYVVKQRRRGDLERRSFLVHFNSFGPSYEWKSEKDVSVKLIEDYEKLIKEYDKLACPSGPAAPPINQSSRQRIKPSISRQLIKPPIIKPSSNLNQAVINQVVNLSSPRQGRARSDADPPKHKIQGRP